MNRHTLDQYLAEGEAIHARALANKRSTHINVALAAALIPFWIWTFSSVWAYIPFLCWAGFSMWRILRTRRSGLVIEQDALDHQSRR